jgi:hypothetical protein
MFNKCKLRGPNIQYLTLINCIGVTNTNYIIHVTRHFMCSKYSNTCLSDQEQPTSLPYGRLELHYFNSNYVGNINTEQKAGLIQNHKVKPNFMFRF